MAETRGNPVELASQLGMEKRDRRRLGLTGGGGIGVHHSPGPTSGTANAFF